MKKCILLILFVLVSLFSRAQHYKSLFSTKNIRLKMRVAEMNLRRADVLNNNMVLIPIFRTNHDVVYKSEKMMVPDYIKKLTFLEELDSISKVYDLEPFLFSTISTIVYDKSTESVYVVSGDLRFPSPNYGMNKKRDFSLREVWYRQEEISRFIAKLYISNSLDYIFIYPTHWDDERVWVYGIYFAIKDDRVYIISDFSQCPALYPIEQFVDVYWKELTGE